MVDVAGNVGGAVSPVLQLAEWLAAPICRQFKYLYNYTTNFKNLEMEVGKLKNTRDEVERKIIAAERNVEVIKQNVKDWQKNVEETITKAEQLIQEKENNSRCFKGLSPNFIIHYKQSRKAFKLKRDGIDPLLQQERELSPVSYQTNPPEIWLRPSENYLAFESRNSTVKNVWDALNDGNVFMIGVYGMGGLGKTTFVEELGRKAEKDKLFEDIVFVEVSESPDVKKIQTTIANKLGLKFENENEREMANKMYSRMKDKNILLILDNIWEPLEFEKTIGIPCGVDRRRNKLLFTTRNLDVLERMGSTNNFQMGILNEEEAWTLFTKMIGNIIQTRELHSLPNDICKECKGLPIVICTIAKALKNKSRPYDWNYALQELRAPSPTKFTRFLEEDYTKIALSYKYLRDDELKKTFLISSLMENNTSISNLFRHVVCLDVFDGVNLTMEEARDRLDKLVCDLKDACLLLDGFKSGQFAMHDVVRVVAMTIAYVDHHVFTTRNDVERDWKNKDKLKKCTKISLPGNSTIISQLWPNDFDCPNLEYFHMTYMWNSSFKIPEDFFTVMPKLRVLNFVGLQQSSLPSSIHCLTNLQTLCLDYSQLESVPIIGKLKKLKVLSLKYSNIKDFPTEMGQLTQLKLLDLSYCFYLRVIAPNVMSKLSQLEELYLKECLIWWKIEVLEELKLLFNLSSLELDIKDEKNIISRKIWDNQLPSSSFQNLKELILQRCAMIKFVFPYTITKNLQQLQYLEIKDCIDLEEIVATEEITEAAASFVFPQVTVIKLGNLPELATFCRGIHTSEWPKLKQLEVRDCDKFKLFNSELNSLCLDQKINHDLEIFEVNDGWEQISWWSQYKKLEISYYESAPIPLWLLQRFENLTCLSVYGCHELVNLTTPSTARSLVQLRELKISYCKMLMEILEIEEDATTEIIFENLNKLSFEWMENLTCFCSGNYTFNFRSLEELNIAECPNMKTFCRGILSTPKLQKISYEEMEVENEGNDLNKTIQELYKKEKQVSSFGK
ncbi:probable disease resistance protein At4g27220 [Mangifera indica]|uniref:probable disease resistance protein At4g27220 n=1 Tax=Mangifera indica TaxID=29780 RepID=UPI001CFBD7EC|nr:probable disease resistance protein At4g27220 [Mangifera indica]